LSLFGIELEAQGTPFFLRVVVVAAASPQLLKAMVNAQYLIPVKVSPLDSQDLPVDLALILDYAALQLQQRPRSLSAAVSSRNNRFDCSRFIDLP